MERSVVTKFESLISNALVHLTDVRGESSTFQHTGSTKRSLDALLLSQAGIRHGLGVVSLSEQTQVISDGHRLVGFHQNMPSTLTSLDRTITNDKHLTKRVLSDEGLPVAEGATFTNIDEALAFLRSMGGPVVVKPLVGSNGRGITVGVQDESRFRTAVAEALAMTSRILVEECLPSIDLRIMVIGGHAAAAMMRVPANIQGDGSSTVRELIARKNAHRRSNAFHRFVPIQVTPTTEEQLAEAGLRLDSVLERGRRVFLHYKANLSSGGDSINVTNFIHTGFLRLAERAMKCFGSVSHAGVDILAERLDRAPDDQRCIICEINCNNDLPIHVFPLFGESIDVAAKEIETYFPGASRVRRRWRIVPGRPPELLPADERKLLRTGREVERAQARYAELPGWSGLVHILDQPEHHDYRRPADSPRALDTHLLAKALGDLGWDNVRPAGRLLISERDDHDTIIERSGRAVFTGSVTARPEVVYKLLNAAGVQACLAERLQPGDLSRATALVKRSPGPWTLIRPVPRRRNAGARVTIRSVRSLAQNWPEFASRARPLVLKQAADSLSISLLFVDGRVVTCNLLLPTSLIGDGRSTVEQLIEQKLSTRERHPYLGLLPIRPGMFEEQNLTGRGLSPSAVLPAGKWVMLSRSPQPKAGAETVGFDTCPVPGLSDIARVAMRLVGDPPVVGVTFAARPPSRTRNLRHWAISEIDPDPLIAEFAWPWAGETPGRRLYTAVAQAVGAKQRYQLRHDVADGS